MSLSPAPGSPDSAKGASKTTASPDTPLSQQVDFEFLNFSHPSEAKASRARRTVRSHVTKHQHQKEQFAAAAARRSKSLPQGNEPNSGRKTPRLRTYHTTATSTPEETFSERYSPQRPTSQSDPSSSVASIDSPLQSPMRPPSTQLDPYEIYPPQWHASIRPVIDHCAYSRPTYPRSICVTSFIPFVSYGPLSRLTVMVGLQVGQGFLQ